LGHESVDINSLIPPPIPEDSKKFRHSSLFRDKYMPVPVKHILHAIKKKNGTRHILASEELLSKSS